MRNFVVFFSLMTAVLVASASPLMKDAVCPDGQSQCPDGDTCCKLSTGEWGCCPLPNAVCCSNGEHCCPQGYTCDVSAGTCTKQDEKIPFFTKVLAKTKYIMCPDWQSECPDGTTCCPLSNGEWNCCPYLGAVCCDNTVYCCPEHYTCGVPSGKCTKKDSVIQSVNP